MATTQTSGGIKKIRTGKRPTVQDAGIAAARMRSSRNGNGHADSDRPPSMIPAIPVAPPTKREELMRIDALETDLARAKAKIALLEDTIEYLRIHSAWPNEWVQAHGGATEPGSDEVTEQSDPAEQETLKINEAEATTPATEDPPVADETTSEADTETTSETTESADPEPSAS